MMGVCAKCGGQLQNGETCPGCGAAQGELRVLSREEHRSFQGVTIDEGKQQEDSGEDKEEPRVYVRTVQFGPGLGWGQRLLWTAVILAVLGLVFFVALPLLLLFLAVVGAIWFLFGRR